MAMANNECPFGADQPKERAEWERGCDDGWNDEIIRWYERRHSSPAYLLGFDAGKAEIDTLVDRAVEHNYSYHRNES